MVEEAAEEEQAEGFKMKNVIILIFGLFFAFSGVSIAQDVIPLERVGLDTYCFDFTKTVPVKVVDEVNTEGAGLKKAFNIDFVIAVIPSLLGRAVEEYAADLFSKWQIGKDTEGKKGILILIAREEQRIKIEIGYDLEEVYTDMYVGQVEREMLAQFLEQADWERGFLSTIENFVERTYRMYKKGVDVRQINSGAKEEYYSGGAGAKTVFDFGAALNKSLPQTPKELREYFGAQPSPQLAFERYMEFNARDMSDYTVDLFSDLSKEFFGHWRTSSGQRRSEAEESSSKSYITKIKGRYAVLMAPFETNINDFITQCPYFFVKNEKGWQVDINTMARSLIMGGPSWHFLSTTHPYMFAFNNYLIMTNRYYPLDGQKAFLGLTYSLWDKGKGGFKVIPEWDSPAKKAGVEDDDILVSIDGLEIKEQYQDWGMMKSHKPGDVVDMVMLRGGEKKIIKVKLVEPKSWISEFPYIKKEGDPWTGFYFAYSEPYERDIEDVQLSVIDVVKDSPAEKAGFKPGDLIYYVPGSQDKHVGFSDYKNLLSKVKPRDKVKLKLLRNLKERLELTLEIGSYSLSKEGF